jgi:hypothetical protein
MVRWGGRYSPKQACIYGPRWSQRACGSARRRRVARRFCCGRSRRKCGQTARHIPAESAGSVQDHIAVRGPSADDKGKTGIRTATVGPVEPEIYQYNFVVGGLRILDPKNPNLRNGWAIDAKPRGLPRTIFPGSVLRNHRAASKIQLSAFKTAASPEPTYCGYRYR